MHWLRSDNSELHIDGHKYQVQVDSTQGAHTLFVHDVQVSGSSPRGSIPYNCLTYYKVMNIRRFAPTLHYSRPTPTLTVASQSTTVDKYRRVSCSTCYVRERCYFTASPSQSFRRGCSASATGACIQARPESCARAATGASFGGEVPVRNGARRAM